MVIHSLILDQARPRWARHSCSTRRPPPRLGKVLEGNSVLDFEPEEVRSGSHPYSARFHNYKWKNIGRHHPGYPGRLELHLRGDPRAEISRQRLFVIDAIDSIKPHSENLWNLANKEGLARALLHQQDGPGAGRFRPGDPCRYHRRCSRSSRCILTLPIGAEESFKGSSIVLKKKAYLYEKDGSGKFSETPTSRRTCRTRLEEIYRQGGRGPGRGGRRPHGKVPRGDGTDADEELESALSLPAWSRATSSRCSAGSAPPERMVCSPSWISSTTRG
ncbi:MAG: hypothetical protein MZU79_09160 [Anaerotruncus sp.]|nr:hypothetical protein [Anaerotruncus sp.]